MNLKRLMIILIIIIIILCLAIGILIVNNKSEDDDFFDDINNVPVLRVTDYSTFYTIESCIQKFITYASIDINEETFISEEGYVSSSLAEALGITTDEAKAEAVMKFIDVGFITENNINAKNIYNYVWNRSGSSQFKLLGLKDLTNGCYAAYGDVIDNNRKVIDSQYYIVYTDGKSLYTIEPITIDIYNDISAKEKNKTIKDNEINNYTNVSVSQDEMTIKYMNDFKEKLLLDIDSAYKMINEDYAKEHFDNIDEFKSYIASKQEQIKNMSASKYKIDNFEDYTQYIIIDQYDNYYVFGEFSIMNYEVLFDSYTVPLESFKELYYSSTVEKKGQLNIERIQEALNNQDYKFIYNKLADSFKSNYFQTQSAFEKYAKDTFFNNNKIEFTDVERQNESYIYTVSISNADNALDKPIEKTMVVQLKEGTDFVFSFSV